jgi:N-formylglutamate amidohydrolase
VCRNKPYAGGFITEHYGRPTRGLHALQIEVNRALYMDEEALEPHGGFDTLAADLLTFAAALVDFVQDMESGIRQAAE